LFKQNNKAKVRQLTKLTIVGKAKVISYKDIEKERVKHAAKEAAAALKKRSRKYKSPMSMGAKAKKV